MAINVGSTHYIFYGLENDNAYTCHTKLTEQLDYPTNNENVKRNFYQCEDMNQGAKPRITSDKQQIITNENGTVEDIIICHCKLGKSIDNGAINENFNKDETCDDNIKLNGFTNKKVASYKVKYLPYFESIDFIDQSESTKDEPYLISLEFYLPGVDCIEDIDIETDGKEIILKTKNKLKLDLKMDYPVLKDPVKSVFFRHNNILQLEMKINETGFRKINLSQTSIETIGDTEVYFQKMESDSQILKKSKENETKFILPDYKVTQSMTDYALTVNSNSMVKGSLRHFYIGNDVLEISFDKYISSSSPIQCRLIFDVSPRKVNCSNSYLNQSKRSLKFTIRKVSPKIAIKAKIGSYYNSLEEIKVLYYEGKSRKKKGKQSEWIEERPERTRSLSESSTFRCLDEDENSILINGSNRLKRQLSNGNQSTRRKSAYFLTSSWPKGILKRSRSTSESAYGSMQDNVFEDYECLKGSGKCDSKQSLDSSNSLCKTSSTDSVSYISGLESSLEDLSIDGSPQKRVVFSGVILKEVYKQSVSIVGAKNKRDYLKKRQILGRKVKKGNYEAQKELKQLNEAYKESHLVVGDECIDFDLHNTIAKKQSKKRNKRKKDLPENIEQEELIFSFDED